jgi:ornithine--oxo-acid transaminase
MQGEAGIQIPRAGFLKDCAQICEENKVLLILDEVQTGLGRTGKLFAFEHENIEPDGLILGKALGGGILPVSAFLAKKEVMQVFTPGSHGSTFGGNALAARLGLEVLNIIEQENLVAKSAELGEKLLTGLSQIQHPAIAKVRGKGLWVGVEINPSKASARKICEKLMTDGILSKETHDTVIRFAPPLTIDEETLLFAISQFEKTISTF